MAHFIVPLLLLTCYITMGKIFHLCFCPFQDNGGHYFYFFYLYILKQHLVNSVLCSECVFMCDVKFCSHIFGHNFAEFSIFFPQHLRVTLVYKKQPVPTLTPSRSRI